LRRGVALFSFPEAQERLFLILRRVLGKRVSRIGQLHLPPGGRGRHTAGRSTLAGIIDLDPRGRIGRMNIDPSGTMTTRLQFIRPGGKETGGLLPFGLKERLHPLHRRENIPRPEGLDPLNQRIHLFPAQQACQRSGRFRHEGLFITIQEGFQGWIGSGRAKPGKTANVTQGISGGLHSEGPPCLEPPTP